MLTPFLGGTFYNGASLPAILVLAFRDGKIDWDKRQVITTRAAHNLDLMVVIHCRDHYMPGWWGRDRDGVRPHALLGTVSNDIQRADQVPAYGEMDASALLLASVGAAPLGHEPQQRSLVASRRLYQPHTHGSATMGAGDAAGE